MALMATGGTVQTLANLAMKLASTLKVCVVASAGS
jgi:hypothetical protein